MKAMRKMKGWTCKTCFAGGLILCLSAVSLLSVQSCKAFARAVVMKLDVSRGIVHGAETYLAEAMESAAAFLAPDAEAVDLVVDSALPTIFFDDTNDEDCQINHDWQITASGGISNNDANNVFTISGMGESGTGTCGIAIPIITVRHTGAAGLNSPENSLVIGTNGDLHFAGDRMFFDRSLSRLGVGTNAPLYRLSVSGTNSNRSTLHFTNTGTDVGGWLTSVLDNNFFVSSGAMYDASIGGWTQKSPDGQAVMAGSGGLGYRIFLTSGTAPEGTITLGAPKLHIDYAGNVGINKAAVAGRAIDTSTGGYLTPGGVWQDFSSREAKDNIRALSAAEAAKALEELNPVTFTYKAEPGEQYAGFIAEDVPDLVASSDRKGLSPMDIVAVMTKVVQEQQNRIDNQNMMVLEQRNIMDRQQKVIDDLSARIERLERMR